MLDRHRRLYNDLSPSEQEHWTALLRPHPASTQRTSLNNEAYRHVSTPFLFCRNDQALPVFVQERYVINPGVEVQTERCASGHSPLLSMPEKVVDVVERLTW